MEPLVVLAVAAFVVLIAVGAIHAHKKAEERRAAMRAWAASLGWTFSPRHDGGFDDRHRAFDEFRHGHSRSAYNTITGELTINERPHRVSTGDYTYKTTSTDSKGRTTTTTHRFSYLLLVTPYPGLPGLTIRREHLFDKIGAVLGFDDIDFEDAEFSKRFMVESKDRRLAYDLCSVRMIEFLKEHASDAPPIRLEAGELLLATSGTWSVEEFRNNLDFARAFIDRWPDHMLARLEGDSSFRPGVET